MVRSGVPAPSWQSCNHQDRQPALLPIMNYHMDFAFSHYAILHFMYHLCNLNTAKNFQARAHYADTPVMPAFGPETEGM